jgi:hypothetical protein
MDQNILDFFFGAYHGHQVMKFNKLTYEPLISQS